MDLRFLTRGTYGENFSGSVHLGWTFSLEIESQFINWGRDTVTTDLKINIGILGISSFLYFYSFTQEIPSGSNFDSMIWPRIILVLAIAFSIFSIIGEWIKIKRLNSSVKKDKTKKPKNLIRIMTMFIPIIVAFIYVWGVGYLGFFLATVIFIPALMYLLGERKIKSIISTPLVFLFIVWVVFIKFGGILLPTGEGIFRELSNFIMYGI
jgi:putative tricarboxylic transport membrane protein